MLLSRKGRYMERAELTTLLQLIKTTEPEKSDLVATILKLAADSITLQTLQSLTNPGKVFPAVSGKKNLSEEEKIGTLSFTKKELESMPKSFQKAFIFDNRIVKFRYYEGLFQARYRKQGYNIEVASKDFDTMKKKFIEKLIGQAQIQDIPVADPKRRTAKTVLFADYAKDWLKLMLNCIFDMAAEDFNLPSPMKKIVLPYHESKKGCALTKAEEKKLVEFCRNRKDDVASALLVLLYFGLRQSELPTLKVIDGNTLECETSKERMGRNVTLRYIPFTPMFRKVQDLVDFEKAKSVNVYTLRSAFKRLFPEHHPHELRYTFITRCKECGVNHELVMLWDGHSGDKDVKTSAVDRGYTDYSKEYIFAEAEKVIYDL